MQTDTNKESAVAYLQLIGAGKIDEAYEKYMDMAGKHHNLFTPAGFEALREGMKGANVTFPDMQLDVQHVLGDGDLVATHSHLTLEKGTAEFTAVHLFRFENGRIVEIWDLSQPVTADSANTDGAF